MQFLFLLQGIAAFVLLHHTQAKRLGGLTTSFCVLQGDGQNFCIGDNSMGSFGIGTPLGNVLTPTKMLNVVRGIDICVGEQHSCIVDEGGQAKCSGDNYYKQLGSGINIASSNFLVQVSGLETGVREVFCGPENTCAIMDSGAALCWGENTDGQLGAGDKLSPLVPSVVLGFETGNAKDIAIGDDHICILHVSGDLYCSGKSTDGQLGDPNANDDVLTPTKPVGLPAGAKFQSVACGADHTCAVTLGEGAVWCWGSNFYGQLGIVTGYMEFPPTQVVGLATGARAVWASQDSTYVLMQDGSAKAFGENSNGEFSIGKTLSWTNVPVDFDDNAVTNIVELRGGYKTTCILLTTGSVQCTGSNQKGQLGTGSASSTNSYYLVTLPMIAGLSPTRAPSMPTAVPTQSPTRPTRNPTLPPTSEPTDQITQAPSQAPITPSVKPTRRPSRGLVNPGSEPSGSLSNTSVYIFSLLVIAVLAM